MTEATASARFQEKMAGKGHFIGLFGPSKAKVAAYFELLGQTWADYVALE